MTPQSVPQEGLVEPYDDSSAPRTFFFFFLTKTDQNQKPMTDFQEIYYTVVFHSSPCCSSACAVASHAASLASSLSAESSVIEARSSDWCRQFG